MFLGCGNYTDKCPLLGFPVIMICLIPLRWKILPKMFTPKEFRVLDAPTADNDVVLASLGGKPRMPEDNKEREDVTDSQSSGQEDKWSAAEEGASTGVTRQRGGQYKRE